MEYLTHQRSTKRRSKSKSHLGIAETPTSVSSKTASSVPVTDQIPLKPKLKHKYSNSQGMDKDWLAMGIVPGQIETFDLKPVPLARSSSANLIPLKTPENNSNKLQYNRKKRITTDKYSLAEFSSAQISPASSPTNKPTALPQNTPFSQSPKKLSTHEEDEGSESGSESSVVIYPEDQNLSQLDFNQSTTAEPPRLPFTSLKGPIEQSPSTESVNKSLTSQHSSSIGTDSVLGNPSASSEDDSDYRPPLAPSITSSQHISNIPKLSFSKISFGTTNEALPNLPISPKQQPSSNQQPNPSALKMVQRPHRQIIGDRWMCPLYDDDDQSLTASTIENMYLSSDSSLMSVKFANRNKQQIPTPLLKPWPNPFQNKLETLDISSEGETDSDEFASDDELQQPETAEDEKKALSLQNEPAQPATAEDEKKVGIFSAIVNKIKRITPSATANLASPPAQTPSAPAQLSSAPAPSNSILMKVLKPKYRTRKLTPSEEIKRIDDMSDIAADELPSPRDLPPEPQNQIVLTRAKARTNIVSTVGGTSIRGPYFNRLQACADSMCRVQDNIAYVSEATIEDIRSFHDRLDVLTAGHETLERKIKKLSMQIDDAKHASKSAHSLLNDNVQKTVNAIYHIKFTQRTKSPMKALLVVLSILVLIVGTLIWFAAASWRISVRTFNYVKGLFVKNNTQKKNKQSTKPTNNPSKPSTNMKITPSSPMDSDGISVRIHSTPLGAKSPIVTPPVLSPSHSSITPSKSLNSPLKPVVQLGSDQLQTLQEMSRTVKALRMQDQAKKRAEEQQTQ